MAEQEKPTPKTQEEISRELVQQRSETKVPDTTSKNRGEHRSVKGDKTKVLSIGLQDIDEAILFYFDNVIQPSVVQNGRKVNVPVLYGSPERWKAVQKDGYYRDKNGKIQAPLIMYKRTGIEKNRSLSKKLDANNPRNFYVFKKKFSKKNVYDHFGTVNNRKPVEEYYGVVIPSYLNLTYSCVIFTDYIQQMNKIVESIDYASDSYWGDPKKFRFQSYIDSYNTMTDVEQGADRKVRTEFNINLHGYVIPDAINAQKEGMNKIYTKSRINIGTETVTELD